MTNKITKTTWRLLQERLDIVLKDDTPKRVEKREFYYICRKAFQDEWDLLEVDIKGADDGSRNPYISWGDLINKWALKQCNVMSVEQGRFWRVMAKLNIWPHERGTCLRETSYGARRETVVKHSTKEDIMENCSFIIVSEKMSKAEELYNALRNKGYMVNLISMGGHSTGAVQSIAAEVGDLLQMLDVPNFYIIVLHDYDIDGILMVYTLRKWFDNVLDVGINRELLVHSGIDKDKKLYEVVKIKKYPTKLLDWVTKQAEYTHEELIGLLGTSDEEIKAWFKENLRRASLPKVKGVKKLKQVKWNSTGKRIELDTIYGVYGIEPMVKYIHHVLQFDTDVWDLTRIGVEEQELEEPEDHYEKFTDRRILMVSKKYAEKRYELSKTSNRMKDIISEHCKLPYEYTEVTEKFLGEDLKPGYHWTFELDDGKQGHYNKMDIKGLDSLKMKYILERNKKWKDNYQPTVDEEINDYLTCWESDVTTAEDDINDRVNELQKELDEAKENDPDLVKYKKELRKIDWGKDELESIKPEDPVRRVRRIIAEFQKYIMELEDEEE